MQHTTNLVLCENESLIQSGDSYGVQYDPSKSVNPPSPLPGINTNIPPLPPHLALPPNQFNRNFKFYLSGPKPEPLSIFQSSSPMVSNVVITNNPFINNNNNNNQSTHSQSNVAKCCDIDDCNIHSKECS